jgi:hypothetical protein
MNSSYSFKSLTARPLVGQECWCSDTLDTTSGGGVAASASFCNAPCSGDSATMCGGSVPPLIPALKCAFVSIRS